MKTLQKIAIKLSPSISNVIYGALSCVCLNLLSCASTPKPAAMSAFIDTMATKHHFNKTELDNLFQAVELKTDIIKKITSPAEAIPWYKYRKIFMTDTRINDGVKFWQAHAETLAAVEKQYGVPAEIIVAILGVETQYGQHTGKYRVIDALSTLAFAYPKRSTFFLQELEKFLLLCQQQHLDPLQPTGSYAGAMGMPQFMPSSFMAYAIDFNGNKIDIWRDPSDAIASIANYLAQHHWQPNQAIALPLTVKNHVDNSLLNDELKTNLNDLKPNLRLSELESLNLTTPLNALPLDSKVKLLAFQQPSSKELWATLDNFYVVTRYNHSPLYAMAVYQLSQSILNKKGSSP